MRCSLVRRLIISLVGAVISIAISADEQPNNRFVSTAQPLPSWIAAFTGDAELQIERIVIGRDELQNVVVPIHFGSRNFSMRGAQGAIGSGSAALDWHHDIASARNSLTLAGHDLRAGDIATLRPVIDAPIDFHIELDGQGRSLHEFLAGARGYVKADLGAGAFASNDLERAGRDLLSYMVAGLNPFASRQGETPFKCARARFAVHRGDVPELQLFGLQTEQFTVLCNGKLNFGTEQVGLICRPHQHKRLVPDGLSVVQSVEIFGTFSKPEIKVNKLGVLKRGVSLGIGFTGFGINQIGDLLAQARPSTVEPCLIQELGAR